MEWFQVFLIISIVKVNFCYPDFRKRQLLSRASRSEIIHSLESMVDNTTPSENGVIHSLENMVDKPKPDSSESTSHANQLKLGSFSLQSDESNKTNDKNDGNLQNGYSNETFTNPSLNRTLPQMKDVERERKESSFMKTSVSNAASKGSYLLNIQPTKQVQNSFTEMIKAAASATLFKTLPAQSESDNSSRNEDVSSGENENAVEKELNKENMEDNSGSGSDVVSTIKGVHTVNTEDVESGEESTSVEDGETPGSEEYSTISKKPGNAPENAQSINSNKNENINPEPASTKQAVSDQIVNTYQSGDSSGSGTDEDFIANSNQPYSNLNSLKKMPGHFIRQDVGVGSNEPVIPNLPTAQISSMVEEEISPNVTVVQSESFDDTTSDSENNNNNNNKNNNTNNNNSDNNINYKNNNSNYNNNSDNNNNDNNSNNSDNTNNSNNNSDNTNDNDNKDSNNISPYGTDNNNINNSNNYENDNNKADSSNINTSGNGNNYNNNNVNNNNSDKTNTYGVDNNDINNSNNNNDDNNKANSSNINTSGNANIYNNNVNYEISNNNDNSKSSNISDENDSNSDSNTNDVTESSSYDNEDESGSTEDSNTDMKIDNGQDTSGDGISSSSSFNNNSNNNNQNNGSTEDSNTDTSNENDQDTSGDGISSGSSINNNSNNNNQNNNSGSTEDSNTDTSNENDQDTSGDSISSSSNNNKTNNYEPNAEEENSTYSNIEEELRQLKIRIDFNTLKNKLESTINDSIATANLLDQKKPPNLQTGLTGSSINETHTTQDNETPLPLEDINANTTDNSNESDEATEQEKKLIALAALTEDNTTSTSQEASQIKQGKTGKEVKNDYDLENEKKLIAASVGNSQNKDEEGTKTLTKVENSAELHIHAKASFQTTYFERKGEKVVKQYDEDRLSTLLDDLKFGKEPATVNRSMDFVNLKQCGLFVEDYNVTKIGESWNRGILSQYQYMYELPKHFSKCSTSAWFNNTDMRGSVFLSFQVRSILGNTMMNNARVCAKYCCHEPRCKAWTLRIQEGETRNCDKGSYCCWLKSAVPEVQTGAENSTSGIVDRVKTRDPPTGMRSAVPLGGITTGSFELHADGTFHEWTIENQSPGGSAKLNKGALDMALLGVRVSSKNSTESALLRTFPPLGYPGVETLSYSGAYPVSKLTPGGKIANQVNMDLYAFPSFQPRNPYNSAVPAVAFALNVENKDQIESVNVSFMLNLPLGSQEDTIRVGDNYGEAVYTRNILPSECAKACAKMPKCMAWTTNGPTACLLKDKMPLHAWQSGIISGLKGIWSRNDNMLTMERPGFFPQSGSMTLHAMGGEGETTSFAVSDDFRDIWRRYQYSGMVGNTTNVTITGIYGSASIQTLLKPGQKKSLTIIMSWYYPNRDHAKMNIGNFYTNLFASSEEVAAHMRENILETVENIINWQVPFLLPNSFPQGTQPMNKLPLWLNDMLMNSVSYWRSSFWTKDGRWRQWEAYDCNDVDTIHNDMQRILPYMMFYPEVVRHLLLTWAANQFSNGMIEETLAEGCLGPTGKLDNGGGRIMADTTSMFVVGVYHYYKWTGNKNVLDKLWPSCKKAITWLIVDSTKGTGLPFRKTTFYSLSGIDKYDHHIYDSMVYLLALRASRDMAIRFHDFAFERTISSALDRGQTLVEKEFWNKHNNHYRAWWDMEYGAGDWLMSDSFYGQVWAYTLGLGDLVPRVKLRNHLEMEVEINGSPWGLRVIDDKRPAMTEEDTSLILSYKYPGCESLENVSKHKAIWMGADANWASLMINLETDPRKALEQAKKPLDHWRSNLNDQWNIHGQISSGGYGQDGLPWANSHSNNHLVMWHLPLAVSGQQYSAPDLSLTFWPMMPIPFQLPFFIPTATGLIEGKMVGDNDFFLEEMFTFRVTSGEVKLKELKIFGAPYGRGKIHLAAGSVVSWSKPRANVKNILSELKN